MIDLNYESQNRRLVTETLETITNGFRISYHLESDLKNSSKPQTLFIYIHVLVSVSPLQTFSGNKDRLHSSSIEKSLGILSEWFDLKFFNTLERHSFFCVLMIVEIVSCLSGVRSFNFFFRLEDV